MENFKFAILWRHKLQAQLLEKREEVIVDVQIAAKEEINSFSLVLNREFEKALASNRIQKAVTAASEDRSCNIEGNHTTLLKLATTENRDVGMIFKVRGLSHVTNCSAGQRRRKVFASKI